MVNRNNLTNLCLNCFITYNLYFSTQNNMSPVTLGLRHSLIWKCWGNLIITTHVMNKRQFHRNERQHFLSLFSSFPSPLNTHTHIPIMRRIKISPAHDFKIASFQNVFFFFQWISRFAKLCSGYYFPMYMYIKTIVSTGK